MYSELIRLFIFIFVDLYRVKCQLSFLLWNAQELFGGNERPEPVFPERQAVFARFTIENSVDTVKINEKK